MIDVMQQGNQISVRERTRRAVRAELTMLGQELIAAKGYEQATIDDIVAAAGMSKRTFFRYFASKEDLVLSKYEFFGDQFAEAFAARPRDEPVWESFRRAFDVVVGYFDDTAQTPRILAMEKIISGNTALSAGELERVSRVQEQLAVLLRERTGRHSPTDPGPAAITGAALSCLLAAKATWITAEQRPPFGDLLDHAMAALQPA
jgi:AcrR family transcriptional regulator